MPKNKNPNSIAQAIKAAARQAIDTGKQVAGKGSKQNPINLDEVEVTAPRIPREQSNGPLQIDNNAAQMEPKLEKLPETSVNKPKNRWQKLQQQAKEKGNTGSILDGTSYGRDYGGNAGSKYAPTKAVPKVIGDNAISRALAKGKIGKILGMQEDGEQNNNKDVYQQSTSDTTCSLISNNFDNLIDPEAINNSNYFLTPKVILCQTPSFKNLLKELNSNAKIIVRINDIASQTAINNNALGFTGIMVRVNGQLIGLQQYTGTLDNIAQFDIQAYSRNNIDIGDVIETIVHEVTIHAKQYFDELSSIIKNGSGFDTFRQQYINDVLLASNPINTINTPDHDVIRNFSTTDSSYKALTIAILEKIKDLFKDKVVNDIINPSNLYNVNRTLGSQFDSNGNRIPKTGIVYTEPKSMYNKYLRAVLKAVQTYSGGAASTGIYTQYVLTQESPNPEKYPDIIYLE